jgi:hypothetical protein
MTLGILLPTRGRPKNLARFIAATKETAVDWHIYLRLDYDDPSAADYDEIIGDSDPNITVVHGERIGLAASLNELAARAERDGISHIGMFGDDVLPITEGWDKRLVEALGDNLGVAYGDDGLRHKHAPDLPTHYITQTEVYRRLGYLAPPTMRHLFLDNVARDVGRYLKNFVYVPVKIAHLHPWLEGEHLHDTTYAEGGRNADLRRADHMAYVRWSSSREWKKRLR